MSAHSAADGHRHDQEHEGDVDRRRERDVRADPTGDQCGQAVLAVGADVEQVHLEPDRHRHTGDVERHRRLMMITTDSVESIVFHISVKASTGLLPETSRAIDEMTIATTAASERGSAEPATGVRSIRLPPVRRTGHVRAEFGGGDGRRVEFGDDPTAQHHQQPVGQADQFVEVGRDQQHRRARARGRRGGCPRSTPGLRRRHRGSGVRRSASSARRASRARRSASAGCRPTA